MLKAFLKADEGSTIVEFAFIAPICFVLMMAIIDFSMIMTISSVMEGATNSSSRLGKTGFTAVGISRDQTIRNEIAARSGGLIDMNNISITSKSYSRFDNIGDPEPWNDANRNNIAEVGEYNDINGNGQYDADMGKAGYGGADEVVVYTISYPWRIVTPAMNAFIGNNGIFTVTTTTVVKNEPY